jgi:hypothetical protein
VAIGRQATNLSGEGQPDWPESLCYNGVLLGLCKSSLAEVVELADTPSEAITLAILYKLLILQLLTFFSTTSKYPEN